MKFRNKYFSAILAAGLIFSTGCADLEVENLNDPDIETLLQDDADIISYLNGGYLSWYYAADHQGLFTLEVTGDYFSSAWGNFGMRDLGEEPRTTFNNQPTYANADGTNFGVWNNLNSALNNANAVLNLINNEGRIIMENGQDVTPRVKASAEFLQGISLGYLGLFFDQAFPMDENVELGTAELVPYTEIIDLAMEKLDAAIATSQGQSFTMNYFNGLSLSADQLSALANSMAARFLAYEARNKEQNEAAEWSKVLTYARKGIDFDFAPEGDANVWTTFGRWLGAAGPTQGFVWTRVDQRIVSLLSTNGFTREPTQPARYPLDGSTLGPIEGAEDARLETDFGFEAPIFPAARGYYFFSNYYHDRYAEQASLDLGAYYLMLKAENDLLIAEALIRTNQAGAAELINITRVGRGELAAASDSDANLLDKLYYERQVELMNTMTGLGFLDARRFGISEEFNPGTIKHYPVPGQELELLEVPYYTFGGSN